MCVVWCYKSVPTTSRDQRDNLLFRARRLLGSRDESCAGGDLKGSQKQNSYFLMDDDEDSFLYGDSVQPVPQVQKTPENVVEVISVPAEGFEKHSNGVIENLEAEAEERVAIATERETENQSNGDVDEAQEDQREMDDDDDDEVEEVEEGDDDSDEDIEFILEPPTRSLDFRNQRGGHRPTQARTTSVGPTNAPVPATNLTTEYTPRERGAPPVEDSHPSLPGQAGTPRLAAPSPAINVSETAVQPTDAERGPVSDGPDPSTLPAVRAPPSYPHIDPNAIGVFEGRPIFDIDMTNLAERPWRRPGSDLSDWFNYGFDEISWEAYCYRRRAMGEMAGVLKANVLGFAGMPEEQLLALPPEARTMVMTGTHAIMSGGGGPNGPAGVGVGPGMMPPVGMNAMGPMNPMMAAEMGGMGGMGPMGVGMGGPMGMGMNGDMNVGMPGPGQGPGPMMQDGVPGGPVLGQVPGQAGPSGTPEQGGQMSLPDGMPGGPGGMMGMNMNMGDYAAMQQMQDVNMQGPHIHPGMEPNGNGTPAQVPIPPRVGSTPASFRGRGGAGIGGGVPVAPRGGRGVTPFPARGRGRGAVFDPSALPGRPPSPLPPGVPTGPRNLGNKYRDRDNNAPAVEGLDYGGNKEGSVSSPLERERDREKSERDRDRDRDKDRENPLRKRRSPPSNEEDRMGRSSKRR